MRRKWKYGLAVVAALLAAGAGYRWLAPGVLDGVSFSQVVLDHDGKLLRLTLSGDEKYRIKVKLPEVEPRFIEALLLLEDRHFYEHPGINPWAALRGLKSLLGGDARVGGSTLTMQLARVRYGLRTRSLRGKLSQMLRAFQIELKHSKREILEAYLNTAPFGANIEGIGAASLIYFGKMPGELTLSESLLLAVIPQSPTVRNLSEGGSPQGQAFQMARERLISRWAEAHPSAERGQLADLSLPLVAQRLKQLPFRAPHFVEMALKEAPSAPVLHTTLDSALQTRMENRIQGYLKTTAPLGVRNAAAILVENATGEVRALVGSRDFNDDEIQGQVNGALAKRSPGSTLKPFVYALALERGLIHPHSLLKDTPRSFAGFDPENFDRHFAGPIAAEDALVESRNVPAIELSQRLGQPGFYDFLKGAGVRLPRDEKYYGLGIVLGGAEVSMWEMAHLYGALARRGVEIPLTLLARDRVPPGHRILSPESSFITLEMLTRNQRPGRGFLDRWVARPYPIAWKTGTSYGFRDAWTAGVLGPYTLIVWLGNFDNLPNQALVGREMAAPLFFQLAESVATPEFAAPPWLATQGLNLKKVHVCSLSGELPEANCPHQVRTWFIPGVSPITPCAIHRQILVDRRTGLRSCKPPSDRTEFKVFEFWPTDLLDLFKLAGIERKPPPPYAPDCPLSLQGALGAAPQITSPREQVTYLQSLGTDPSQNQISLKAIVDGDVRMLYWFLNQRFLGKADPAQPFVIPAQAGDYLVSVVDDQGRSSSRKLKIRTVQ